MIPKNLHASGDIIGRLLWLVGDRRLYSWGKSLGFKSATIARIKKGQTPSSEMLSTIARVENASITWLLTGRGQPYLVQHAESDEDLAEQLRDRLDDEDWDIDLLHDGENAVVALTLPALIGESPGAICYHAVELFAGPVGPATAALIRPRVQESADIGPDRLRALTRGMIGPRHVLDWIGEGDETPDRRVAELAAHYGTQDAGALSPEEQVWVRKYRQLGRADRTRAQAVIDALADAGNGSGHDGIGQRTG